MKPLLVLLGTFAASMLVIKLFAGGFAFSLAGRIAMAAMLFFTAMGHFVFVKGMAMMMPGFIPRKAEIVYLTGLLEIAAAIALLIPRVQTLAVWLLILFFMLILPANINAAINKIDYEKGTADGSSVSYPWFRVPLQLFFIAWVYFFAIKTH